MTGPDLEDADLESRVAAGVAGVIRQYTHGGHWKITRYMYQQMPEQPGGDCSGI
jgi:hypothetical protein